MPGRSGALIAALLVAFAAPPLTAAEPVAQSYTWRDRGDEGHGGYSAIHVEDGGDRMIVIGDRGRMQRAAIRRDATGRITGIDADPAQPLLSARGTVLTDKAADAEGIAVDGQGRIYVSFENRTRVLRYDRPGAPATPLPIVADFRALPLNGSLEGLAVDPSGAVWTVAETPLEDGSYQTWIWDTDGWRAGPALPGGDGFAATGLDFDDDGRLYLLERALRGLAGFQSRVRRFDLAGGDPVGQDILLSGAGQFDNLEGISVWRDAGGALRLTMISDDNFFFVQRTELVEIALPD